MTYHDFLTRVIDDGIAAARRSYARPDQKHKLEGSVAGFEACRGKGPHELAALLRRSGGIIARSHGTAIRRYWRLVCFQAEVEWVCNVVSAALWQLDQQPIITPTARGVLRMGEILGENNFTVLENGVP